MKLVKQFSAISLVLITAMALSACSSLPAGQFVNRISCDPSMMEMFIGSKYGPLYIGSDVKKEDAEIACQAILLYHVMGAKQQAAEGAK